MLDRPGDAAARVHPASTTRSATCSPRHYPAWTDDEVFQRARLVVAALIAKIHTVEWTPAVISHPTTVIAHARQLVRAGRRAAPRTASAGSAGSEIISGIPGAATEHYGVPFSLTEEFAAVYRMHPLVPDDWSIRGLADDRPRSATTRCATCPDPTASRCCARTPSRTCSTPSAPSTPALVSLHNFPRFLQQFVRPDGKIMDLAATDILRHRERGVPRYCEFRRLLHLDPPARSFEDLTSDPADRRGDGRAVRRGHRGVDLMVGPVRRGEAGRLRLQRHRFPHLHPDGLAPAEQRPVLHHATSRPPSTPRQGLQWIADNTWRRCCSGTGRSSGRRCAAPRTPSRPGRSGTGHDLVRPRLMPEETSLDPQGTGIDPMACCSCDRPLSDLFLWLWRLERRLEFLYRPQFDRRLRGAAVRRRAAAAELAAHRRAPGTGGGEGAARRGAVHQPR